MKIKILKYYIYRCDCHGANCPNERKLEFHSTGQGTFEILMFERGLHSSSSCVPKMRGIDTRLLEFIDYLCRQGKPSKEIRFAVLQKAKAGQWGTIEDIVIPSEKQIFNRKTSVMKSLSRIATTEQFQASSSSITSLLEQTAKKDDDYVLSLALHSTSPKKEISLPLSAPPHKRLSKTLKSQLYRDKLVVDL